jgi:hypothetical protein
MAPSAAPPIASAEGSPKAAGSVACVAVAPAPAGDGVAGTAGVVRVAGAGAAGAGAAGVAAGARAAGVEGTEDAAEEVALGCFERSQYGVGCQ